MEALDLDQGQASGSLKRRDASWDKKWQEHIEKKETDLPRSSIFARSPRLPGKVNRSLWENRVVQEAKRPRPRPPPSPVLSVREKTASPKPHYGASLLDYSPSRTATPPYPTSGTASPPPPAAAEARETLPPPPPPFCATDEKSVDWKNDVSTKAQWAGILFPTVHY